jgi:hypothetical protein
MMLLDAAPPPMALRSFELPGQRNEPTWSPIDAVLALSLYTIWVARTGRILRNVPISELTPEELIEFWADDQLDESYATVTKRS